MLLAADALSLINPLTGEGIYYALLSVGLAAEAAIRTPQAAGRAAGCADNRRALPAGIRPLLVC